MEENFEKKGSKTFLKVLLPIILILAILAVGAFFLLNRTKTKPANMFKGVVEKAFAAMEVKEDSKQVKAGVEITASVDSDDTNIKAVNEYLKTAKIKLNGEANLDKEILKYNAMVDFNNENIIDADIILQNKKIYLYAEDFFSKYVEIVPEEFDMEEYTEMIEELFERSNKVSKTETNKLLKDIEKVVLEFLDEQEYETSKEEIKIGGETVKATKATLKLNEKQLAKLFKKVLTVVKDNEYIMDLLSTDYSDLKEELERAIEELDEIDTSDLSVKISLYTTGVMGEIVKAEVIVKENDDEEFKVTYVKESKDKAVVTFGAEDTEIKLEINKKDSNTTVYTLILPEELEGMTLKIEHKKTEKYSGIISLTATIPEEIGSYEFGLNDDVTLKINVSYNVDYNATVSETNIVNSIKINEFTEEDQQELTTKFQSSKLYNVISMFSNM